MTDQFSHPLYDSANPYSYQGYQEYQYLLNSYPVASAIPPMGTTYTSYNQGLQIAPAQPQVVEYNLDFFVGEVQPANHSNSFEYVTRGFQNSPVVHTGVKPPCHSSSASKRNPDGWRCAFCSRGSNNRNKVITHIYTDHLKKVVLQCAGQCGDISCSETFESKDAFFLHKNPKHGQCAQCLTILLKKNMSRHVTQHCQGVPGPL